MRYTALPSFLVCLLYVTVSFGAPSKDPIFPHDIGDHYEKLYELFEQGTLPPEKALTGWVSGRCYKVSAPDNEAAGLLTFFDKASNSQGERQRTMHISYGTNDELPNLFDQNVISLERANRERQYMNAETTPPTSPDKEWCDDLARFIQCKFTYIFEPAKPRENAWHAQHYVWFSSASVDSQREIGGNEAWHQMDVTQKGQVFIAKERFIFRSYKEEDGKRIYNPPTEETRRCYFYQPVDSIGIPPVPQLP